MKSVIVLYEDSRGVPGDFPFHDLLKALVFEVVDGDRASFEQALRDYRPLNGNARVLEACRGPLLALRGGAVVAVFDSDRIRTLLALPAAAADAQVLAEIKKGAHVNVHPVLLKRNMESVLDAIRACGPGAQRQANDKKDRIARDVLLKQATRNLSLLRECLLEQVPSLAELRDLLVTLVRSP